MTDLFSYFMNNDGGSNDSQNSAAEGKESTHKSIQVEPKDDSTSHHPMISQEQKIADDTTSHKEGVGSAEDRNEEMKRSESKNDNSDIVGEEGKKHSPKEKKEHEFNLTTLIRYCGETIALTKLFPVERLSSVTLEDVRKKLEPDFPELSKQRCKIDYDKKKNLIILIVTLGNKGGYFHTGIRGYFTSPQDLVENLQSLNYLAATDGIYEIKKNEIGLFVLKSDRTKDDPNISKLMDLVDDADKLEKCSEGFNLLLPKIPASLFLPLLSFFMDYSKQANVEVMGVFYWDLEKKRYLLDIPFQYVTKFSIDVRYRSDLAPHIIKVAEIHSHNSMGTFFSAIDNRDEVAAMIYGVVGKLERNEDMIHFNLKCRAGFSGRFIDVQPSTVIAGNYPAQDISKNMKPDHSRPFCKEYESYPKEWYGSVIIDSEKGVLND